MKSFSHIRTLLLVTVGCLAGTTRVHALEPLVSSFGLGTVIHPIQKPDCLRCPCCGHRPCTCCKDHVYIFVINGLDPLCLGNLNGMCRYLREAGFRNTRFDQLCTWLCLARRIRQIRYADPHARIVLIGYSLGCNSVRCLSNVLARDGTKVDLLVYLAGDYIGNSRRSYPPNVCRVLNVNAHGLFITGGDLLFNGTDIDGARNCRVKSRHILVPSRRKTLEVLMEELLALACGH
jgi:hypothetical protein